MACLHSLLSGLCGLQSRTIGVHCRGKEGVVSCWRNSRDRISLDCHRGVPADLQLLQAGEEDAGEASHQEHASS